MKKIEASYTVELSLLMPVILLTMFLPIYKGYELCKEVKENSVYVWEDAFCPEEKIRKIKIAENLLEEIK